ncbi:unnamed protein product [Acanthocheilonema viteae]|uniref:Uncharacterized protein n=1 Tax=Acanthocheilonema viteae TaxID=6277 RepID=A0A498S938_ACAVI|nr:unnamed protein product [Acanthocheilonema viteae]
MGSCQSQEAQEQLARNKAIEKQLNQDKRTGSSIVKLLLLGIHILIVQGTEKKNTYGALLSYPVPVYG